MSFDDLKAEALKLTPESRARLAREMLLSLEGLSETEVERLWVEEAVRRDEEADRGQAQLVPADEVFKRAMARLE